VLLGLKGFDSVAVVEVAAPMSSSPDRAGRGAMVGLGAAGHWRRIAGCAGGRGGLGGGGAARATLRVDPGHPGLQSPDVEAGDTEMQVEGRDIHFGCMPDPDRWLHPGDHVLIDQADIIRTTECQRHVEELVIFLNRQPLGFSKAPR